MTDTTVKLGDFTFARFEVPEVIPFGGDQQLAIHKLVGGTRVVDAMGEDPIPLEWGGFLVGSAALKRALYLDGLRKSGKALDLTWSELSFSVVVKTFRCDFQRSYRLPYKITCEVVSDKTAPITTIVDPDPEQAVRADLSKANALSDKLGNADLSKHMSGLSKAIDSISKLAAAAQSEIDKVLLPLEAARAQARILLQATGATISNIATLGGILPGNPISSQVANLTGQIGAMLDQPDLIALDRTLGRMSNNLAAINSGTKSVTVAGGDLFSLAATEYGDAMGWTAIAAANRLSDPEVVGIATLAIPPFTNDTGGILNG